MVQILIISVVFFILNIAYIVLNVPNFIYPLTVLFLHCVCLSLHCFFTKEEERLTDEINENFVQNLPKERLMNELKMAKRVQQALLLVESPEIDGVNIAKKCILITLVVIFIHSFAKILIKCQPCSAPWHC